MSYHRPPRPGPGQYDPADQHEGRQRHDAQGDAENRGWRMLPRPLQPPQDSGHHSPGSRPRRAHRAAQRFDNGPGYGTAAALLAGGAIVAGIVALTTGPSPAHDAVRPAPVVTTTPVIQEPEPSSPPSEQPVPSDVPTTGPTLGLGTASLWQPVDVTVGRAFTVEHLRVLDGWTAYGTSGGLFGVQGKVRNLTSRPVRVALTVTFIAGEDVAGQVDCFTDLLPPRATKALRCRSTDEAVDYDAVTAETMI